MTTMARRKSPKEIANARRLAASGRHSTLRELARDVKMSESTLRRLGIRVKPLERPLAAATLTLATSPSPVIEDADRCDEDRIERAIAAVLTGATCSTACWEAREEICRCSCGGRNHGIAKQGQRGPRTCKAGRARYELVAVVARSDKPYQLATDMSEAATGERQRGNFSMRPNWGPPPLFAVEPSTRAQQKWPEVGQAFAGWDEREPREAPIDLHQRRPHLIWKRIST